MTNTSIAHSFPKIKRGKNISIGDDIAGIGVVIHLRDALIGWHCQLHNGQTHYVDFRDQLLITGNMLHQTKGQAQ